MDPGFQWVEAEPPDELVLEHVPELPEDFDTALADDLWVEVVGRHYGGEYRVEMFEAHGDGTHTLNLRLAVDGSPQARDRVLATRPYDPERPSVRHVVAGVDRPTFPEVADALGHAELALRAEALRAELAGILAQAHDIATLAQQLGETDADWARAVEGVPPAIEERNLHFVFVSSRILGPSLHSATHTGGSVGAAVMTPIVPPPAPRHATVLVGYGTKNLVVSLLSAALQAALNAPGIPVPANQGYPDGPWEYDPDSPLPRRLILRKVDTALPHVSPGWLARYLWLTMTRPGKGKKPRIAAVKTFIHKDLVSPLTAVALKLRPIAGRAHKTVEDAQASFGSTITQGTASRSDAWFVDRVLNGFYPCEFLGDPASGPPDEFVKVVFDWDYCTLDGPYELPNVTARFRRVAGAGAAVGLELTSITVQFRAMPGYGAMSPAQTFTPQDPATHWDFAKRCFRTSYLVGGEIHGHLGQGHLLTEQYLVPLVMHVPQADPLFRLLYPHLRDADAVNNFGYPVIFGPRGVLQTSALTADDIVQTFVRRLGGVDWYQWRPREPICDDDDYARAAGLYWEAVTAYVAGYFKKFGAQIDQGHAAEFCRTLSAKAVRYSPVGGVPNGAYWNTNELSPDVWHGGATSTPRTSAHSALHPVNLQSGLDELQQLCRHAIFHATFYHWWGHDKQVEDGGEIDYAAFALGTRVLPPTSLGAKWDAWQQRVWPGVSEAAYQLFVGDVLVRMDLGYIGRGKEQDDLPWERSVDHLFGLWTELAMRRVALAAHRVDISSIRSRTNT